MTKKRLLFPGLLWGLLLLAGCSALTHSVDELEKNTQYEETNSSEDHYYKPVQTYTGEEYSLPNGDQTDQIAMEHQEEIRDAVKAFFKETYHTEVKVHHIVGAAGGASVSVESIGEPHFYSYAIIPINKKNKEIDPTGVWSQEGQVETAIVSGLYAWINEEKFNKLDEYIEKKVKKHPIVGIDEEALQNGVGNYHTTSYYKVVIYGGVVEEKLLGAYMDQPDRSKEEWADRLAGENVDPSMIGTLIQLYMEEPKIDPSKEIFDEIVKYLSDMEGLAAGQYGFILHDNTIDKYSGENIKDNSLERTYPDEIIKR
ncbi:DUF1672 family protein [Guptibacillus hwajinpoensis]|uniref:DUF1672 family protein n=1 Tax=Guptibacillus hwajinpoensis TaxID=208199 RepID=UPI00384AFF80